jgi:hypothetical protein
MIDPKDIKYAIAKLEAIIAVNRECIAALSSYEDKDEIDDRLGVEQRLNQAISALAAYERVQELLEQWTHDEPAGKVVTWRWPSWCEQLRAAVEGTPWKD